MTSNQMFSNGFLLINGGFGGETRWIFHIPIAYFRNLRIGTTDRMRHDTVRRLFMEAHQKGSYPLWVEEFDTTYAVEFPPDTTDETLRAFVALVLVNQHQEKILPRPTVTRLAVPQPRNKPSTYRMSWWRKWQIWFMAWKQFWAI